MITARFVILLITWSLLASLGHSPALAQRLTWSPDERVPDYWDNTFTPYLLADQYGTVHAFASQGESDEDLRLAIVYRQWSLEGGWTDPMDVLLAPTGTAVVGGAHLDQTGMIHLMFFGEATGAASIYYSRAPATDAGRTQNWSKPEVVGEGAIHPNSSALAGDGQGNLVLIYNGNLAGNGVYAVQSTDNGTHWSEPYPIFLTYDPTLISYSLRLSMGSESLVHAAWNVVTDRGGDISVHYARFDTVRQQWSEPILLEERISEPDFFGPSFPALVATDEAVVVMYNSGNPNDGEIVPRGRPIMRVRLSLDNGESWENARGPFPGLLGRSGEHALAVDSNQNVHAVFVQRIDTVVDGRYSAIGGVWHSMLRNGQWSPPMHNPSVVSPHDIHAVISRGNVLLVTWREDPGAGYRGVWYTYAIVDAPELARIPLPTMPVVETNTSAHRLPSPTPMRTPTPKIGLTLPVDGPSVVRRSPAAALLFAVGPVVLLLSGFVFLRQTGRSRQR